MESGENLEKSVEEDHGGAKDSSHLILNGAGQVKHNVSNVNKKTKTLPIEESFQKIQTENVHLKQEIFASKEIIKKLKSDLNVVKNTEKKINKLTAEIEILRKQNENYAFDHIEQKKQIRQLSDENSKFSQTNLSNKKSYLDLELENYEKSVNDLTKLVDKKDQQIAKFSAIVKDQDKSITTLKSELSALKEIENNYNVNVEKLSRVEFELESSKTIQCELSDQLNLLKNEIRILSAENDQLSKNEQIQKDVSNSQIVALKKSNNDFEMQLSFRNREFEQLKNEFNSYKIRAQSILKQNSQTDRNHLEDKLNDDILLLKNQLLSVQDQLLSKSNKLSDLTIEMKTLLKEKDELVTKINQLNKMNDNLMNDNEKLSAKLLQSDEEVKFIKLNNTTITECYKQQIKELQDKVNDNQIQNQNQNQVQHFVEKTKVDIEDNSVKTIDVNNDFKNVNSMKTVSLDELIKEPSNRKYVDQKSDSVKSLLKKHEMQSAYLTNLLSETEQDLKKFMQMNKVLKDEIRKQERILERDKHIENLEYLKNVVFKFVTLNSGEERLRLVNVLDTMLRLTPDELTVLTEAARGKSNWSNLIWS